jgi:hypothetical protein
MVESTVTVMINLSISDTPFISFSSRGSSQDSPQRGANGSEEKLSMFQHDSAKGFGLTHQVMGLFDLLDREDIGNNGFPAFISHELDGFSGILSSARPCANDL